MTDVQETTVDERIAALVAAIRAAGDMYVIETALDQATSRGDVWPQGGEWPNPSFVIAMINLLQRDPKHARYAGERLTRWAAIEGQEGGAAEDAG